MFSLLCPLARDLFAGPNIFALLARKEVAILLRFPNFLSATLVGLRGVGHPSFSKRTTKKNKKNKIFRA